VKLLISHTQDVRRFHVGYHKDRMQVHVNIWEHVLHTCIVQIV